MQQIIICSRCGQQNQPGQIYCWHCGNTLASGCPNCGAGLEPGARFCGNCGTQMPPMQQQPGGWGQQPPPYQGGWGQQQQQAGWGQPPPQQGAWGPPQQQAGWGQPPPQQGAWGPPPPPPPQQQQGDWGSPVGMPSPGAWGQPTQPRSGSGGLVLLLVVLLIALGGFSYFAFFSDNPPWGKTTPITPGTGTTASLIVEGPFFFVKSQDNSAGKVTMEVKWKTAKPYKGQMEYGKEATYGTSTALESDFVTDHVAPLPNLSMSTSYHYRIVLKSQDNTDWKSVDSLFKTPSPPSE